MTAMNLNRAIRGPVTAVPVVAGKGVRIVPDVENNRFVVEADETVLYENSTGMQLKNGLQLPETLYNFERIRFYVASNTASGTPTITEVPIQISPYTEGTFELFFTNGHNLSGNGKFSWKWKMTLSGTTLRLTLSQYWGQSGTNWTQGDSLNDATVFKVVGINRIANN